MPKETFIESGICLLNMYIPGCSEGNLDVTDHWERGDSLYMYKNMYLLGGNICRLGVGAGGAPFTITGLEIYF